MAERVFISHASEDREVALAVCTALEARGVRCWIAPRDIPPGEDYGRALYEAIVACRVLLLVLSRHSAASPQVLREVEQAFRDRDVIVAFRIDDVDVPPDLEFRVGVAEWLAPPSLDLSAHVGIAADLVQRRLSEANGRATFDSAVERTHRSWAGYPGVVRRLTATWMGVFLWISLALSFIDLVGNADALASIYANQSAFEEVDTIDRVAATSGLQLLISLPGVFIWLAWLCASYLTLEAAGAPSHRYGAGSVPARVLWPGLRMQNGSSVLRDLWRASARADIPEPRAGGPTAAPRWIAAWWWLIPTLVPVMLVTAILAGENELSDEAILGTAAVADSIWLAAGLCCRRFVKTVETRLRRVDAAPATRERLSRTQAVG